RGGLGGVCLFRNIQYTRGIKPRWLAGEGQRGPQRQPSLLQRLGHLSDAMGALLVNLLAPPPALTLARHPDEPPGRETALGVEAAPAEHKQIRRFKQHMILPIAPGVIFGGSV